MSDYWNDDEQQKLSLKLAWDNVSVLHDGLSTVPTIVPVRQQSRATNASEMLAMS